MAIFSFVYLSLPKKTTPKVPLPATPCESYRFYPISLLIFFLEESFFYYLLNTSSGSVLICFTAYVCFGGIILKFFRWVTDYLAVFVGLYLEYTSRNFGLDDVLIVFFI